MADSNRTKRHARVVHHMSHAPENMAWREMRKRCNSPQHARYADYGGRGIAVCERWNASFEAFYEDMGPRPSSAHSLERINNDGNYEPENCRWATPREQAWNRRNNRLLTFQGKTLCAAEWSAITGINYNTIYQRLLRGWTDERVLTAPVRHSAASFH